MDCPKCGVHNPDDAELCRICGNPLKTVVKPSGPTRKCPFCKTENEPDAVYCSGCNKVLRTLTDKAPDVEVMKKEKYRDRPEEDYPLVGQRTWYASIGGIVIMMTALTALVDALLTIFAVLGISDANYDELQDEYPTLDIIITNLVICEGIRIVFILIAVFGAYFAIRRLRWGLAMLGGVFSILMIIPSIVILLLPFGALILLVVVLIDIAAVVMVGLARKEFSLA